MVTEISVVAMFEGNDREFYEQLAEDYEQYVWQVSDGAAECKFGVMSVNELAELFSSWGDELSDDELNEIKQLAVNEATEISRGRGSVYEVTAVA
jgi:hypothetical protein